MVARGASGGAAPKAPLPDSSDEEAERAGKKSSRGGAAKRRKKPADRPVDSSDEEPKQPAQRGRRAPPAADRQPDSSDEEEVERLKKDSRGPTANQATEEARPQACRLQRRGTKARSDKATCPLGCFHRACDEACL